MTRVGDFVELLPGAHPEAENLRHGPNKEDGAPAKGSNVEHRGATSEPDRRYEFNIQNGIVNKKVQVSKPSLMC